MQFTRCHMCEAEGTTTEHVPPRALFPEAKDVQGENYRIANPYAHCCRDRDERRDTHVDP
ncbi:hypothetical protein B0G76_5020 [Paraburkholderia sp. BL23I1N1]|nr:hypothetical protein B0G76_5020 [Paraburkholderia sp. BL23I1N1]